MSNPTLRFAVLLTLASSLVYAQPSPAVQHRISAAIKAAANDPFIDYTAFVNPFIGTGDITYGDVL